MAHPYHHALSSVKKWGGTVDDFIAVHAWLDVTWTGKDFLAPRVAIVHRRDPAVRTARIKALAVRTAGRSLWSIAGSPQSSSFNWFIQIFQEPFDAVCDAVVPFDFSRPAPFFCIGCKRYFEFSPVSKPTSIGLTGHEFCAAEIQVAFAWPL